MFDVDISARESVLSLVDPSGLCHIDPNSDGSVTEVDGKPGDCGNWVTMYANPTMVGCVAYTVPN